jgi:hypothetical protein
MQLKFSQDIQVLLQKLSEKPLTLADLLAETSERGFSLVIGLLVLPFLLPMPPGFTGILGSGCLLLSAQMAIGRKSPWLPPSIAQFQFPAGLTLKLLNQVQHVTKILEKIVRPRLRRLTESNHIWQLNGVCIAWLTILLMLPIPFTNPIPTTGILLLAVAMLEADGLLICISYGLTIAITIVVFGIGYACWQTPTVLLNLLN